MVATPESHPVPTWGKLLVIAATMGFLALQMWVLLNPAGIMSKYSFMEGFTEFNRMMLADPLLTAGLWDLLFLELVFVVILLNGIPRGPAFPFIFIAFVLAMIVYPALGGLAFLVLYWRRLGQFRP